MVDSLLKEGNFDIDEPRALRWLSHAHRRMCARATCIRKRIEVGPSVNGEANYDLPAEVSQIREVLVGGEPYGTGRHSDIAVGQYLWITGAGVVAEDTTAGGVTQISLIPAPGEDGLPIQIYAICRAVDLLAADDTTLAIPEEFDRDVVTGAVANGLELEAMRPDLAAPFWAKYEAACTELLKATRRRFRGPGPTQIRVSGYNA